MYIRHMLYNKDQPDLWLTLVDVVVRGAAADKEGAVRSGHRDSQSKHAADNRKAQRHSTRAAASKDERSDVASPRLPGVLTGADNPAMVEWPEASHEAVVIIAAGCSPMHGRSAVSGTTPHGPRGGGGGGSSGSSAARLD